MSRLVLPEYTVVRDTREKSGHGWTFDASYSRKRPPLCCGTIIDTLMTGDYSAVGYEDIMCIERKADFPELWGNYAERDRFEDELDRMSRFKHRVVLIESHITPEVLELTPPQFTKGVPGKALTRWLMSLTAKFGVVFMPVGQCGARIAKQYIEEVIRFEKDRWAKK